jgi:hypothetical protein
MLVSCSQIITGNPVLNITANRKVEELQKGIYIVYPFGSSDFPRGSEWEYFPEFDQIKDIDFYRGSYGVCDSIENLLQVYTELQHSDREFTVMLTPVIKAEQLENSDWRWCKWGPYIGTQNPQHEYIYDEPNIDMVYVYHIYERCMKNANSKN